MELALSTGLDLLIIIIFIVSIIVGMRKGLIKSAIGLFGKVVALILAFVFSANLGTYIDTNYIHEPMRQWVVDKLSPTAENVKASIEDLDFDALFDDQPEFFVKITQFLGVDDDIEKIHQQYLDFKKDGIDYAKSYVTDALVTPVAATLSRVVAFALIFIVCTIAIALLWWLSNLVINIPVVRKLDKSGGTIIGVVNAFLITFVLVSLINITSGYIMKDTSLDTRDQIITNTIFYKTFNNINPLNAFFGKW